MDLDNSSSGKQRRGEERGDLAKKHREKNSRIVGRPM